MAAVDAYLIQQAKKANRMVTSALDDEVERLLNAALLDLGIAGVEVPEQLDPLVRTAAITYFLVHFGEPEADRYDRLKASYDEQKAQLQMATGYTNWGLRNGQV